MAKQALTTEGLRKVLFQAIEGIQTGSLDCRDANAIAKLAEHMIKSAELEMRYTKLLADLDERESDLSPGPMLLTSGD